MGQLFQKEEALLLGYMLGKYFTAPYTPGFNGSYGNNYPIRFGGKDSDGSGGHPSGNNGKEAYLGSGGDLSGVGGGQDAGGDGASVGLFGFGGNGRGYCSAGGGGGFFGGGSGYINAGGGGGSSFVYDIDSVSDWYMQIQDYMKEQGFSDFQPSDVLAIHNPLLPELNPYFEYNANFGHGRVIINGVIFDYTGTVQTYTVEEDGWYDIECWGAQGGGLSTQQDHTSPYTGGAGGYARARFPLKKGMVLYVYVGEKGGNQKAPLRPFGGGGGGVGPGLAGGGASDVRLVEGDLFSRLIVAGGGGGIVSVYDDLPPDGDYPPEKPDESEDVDSTSKAIDKQMFIISDLSIATVDITYNCSYDIPENSYIRVKLMVDGVHRGTIEKEAIEGGGSDSWVFDNFNEWLEEGTTPYWATLQAVVETNLSQLIIPKFGLIIRVSTKTRPNDEKPKITKMLKEVYDIVKVGSLLTMKLVEVSEPLDLTTLKSNIVLGSLLTINLEDTIEPINLNGELRTDINLGSISTIKLITPPVQLDPTQLETGVKIGSITVIKGV